jgi:hypothetical protein
MQKESVLIDLVEMINNRLIVQEEELDRYVNNAAPQTVILIITGKMLGLIELRDNLQAQIEAGVSAYEISQGM